MFKEISVDCLWQQKFMDFKQNVSNSNASLLGFPNYAPLIWKLIEKKTNYISSSWTKASVTERSDSKRIQANTMNERCHIVSREKYGNPNTRFFFRTKKIILTMVKITIECHVSAACFFVSNAKRAQNIMKFLFARVWCGERKKCKQMDMCCLCCLLHR